MTDEEKARQKARCYDTEYSEDFTMSDMLSRPQDFNKQSIKDVYLCLKEKHYRDGYLDGLTEGKPKWHDLRKDPNDLPRENGKYIIYIKVSEKRTITDTCDFFNGYFGQYIKPIAWCELPKFEE